MANIHPASALARGLRALAAGQFDAAESLLGEALRQAPASPDALSALGQLAARRQQWARAAEAFRLSLDADAAQPRVWLAWAQMLELLSRPEEAVQALVQAVERQPDWAAARFQLARLLRERGQPDMSLVHARQAVAAAPQDVNALQLLAMLQEERGDLVDAEATLRTALPLAPQRATLHHNLGVVLYRRGRHAEALVAHERAQALGLTAAEACYNLGNTLQALGRAGEALDAYRRALSLAPLHALSLYDLSKLRWALGHADFDAELLAAERQAPDSDVPSGLLGLLWLKAERASAALGAFERAARLAPAKAAYMDGQGQALCLLGRHAEARLAHQQALALAPNDAAVLVNAARSLYAGGHTAEALALAERAHALAPHDQHAIALLGVGWRLMGDPREAWLHDMAHVIGVIDIAAPPGFKDIDAFNAALAEELARLHTDAEAPIDQTLRHGTQTRGNLFDLELPMVQLLRRQLEIAISAWLAARPDDPAHPLLGRRTAAWRFADSWSSRLRRSGFHTNHVHGHGWLSSCYYVATPPSALNSQTHQGWLQFGEPDLPEPLRSALPPWRHEAPRPGRLVLFPSYCWHGTVPFDDEAHRLTVAFDVVPA